MGAMLAACLVLVALVPGALGAPRPGTPAATSEVVTQARDLFAHYDEDLVRVDQARDLLEGAVARAPSVDALVLLAWVHLTWADLRAPSPEARQAGYERGRDVARQAIALAPRNAEAHLWYVANLGRWAIFRGRLRTAFLLPTLREEVRLVLELAPDHPAGLSVAGSLALETPEILGGDVAEAEAYQRKALAADPRFTRARVELARCLIAQRRYAEARRELTRVLEERAPRYHADWAVRHRAAATRLLGELAGKS